MSWNTKVLTKLCNLCDPKKNKKETQNWAVEYIETDASVSQPNHLLTILSLKQIFVLKWGMPLWAVLKLTLYIVSLIQALCDLHV